MTNPSKMLHDSTAPLAGVRVLELGTYLAAPLATLHLAGLGASVCAVVRPNDSRGATSERGVSLHLEHTVTHHSRTRAPRLAAFRTEAVDAALNAGKRLAALDLRTDAGQRALRQHVVDSDVLVTNFSAATLRKHGLDAATCATINPTLVHVWMPGFASADEQLRQLTNRTMAPCRILPLVPPASQLPTSSLGFVFIHS